MTYVVGVIAAAVLFGVFTMLRPREEACTGHCAGCTGDGACTSRRANAVDESTRSTE